MGYYIRVEPDVKIFVEDVNPAGQKTILFIHGWPANHKLFEYQFNQLPGLGYRCIGIDIRGFGKSDKPYIGYSYDRIADDIYTIINTLKLENITLVGHSVGGAISIRYMARHNGHNVSKLALLGAAAPSFTKLPNFPYGHTKEETNQLIQGTLSNRPKMLQGFGDLFFFQYTSAPFSDWFFNLGLEAAGYSTAAVLISLRDENLFGDLGKIQVPTLILHGVHDLVCPYPLALAMNQGIKSSKLVPMEKSGHGLFWEEHEKVNQELNQFIG
ncbi:alpha/beta fold hydrolase [Fictibacillus barbaricus]|uniref:Non-heme chloroperoxidase n=1 Tax=Fictibacillus barbaricus TaxID=182136 RepID=A0ABU1TVZ8_9BACL|nr:alpha/beta hydrolase [Fictibacillus barbaricus]MDR7071357.1 non-heme chloroperoxidase [Fictibacillus barbaricus]